MSLGETLICRRSVRKYREEKIAEEKLNQILQAGLLAPTGKNQQPWEFLLIENRETLGNLACSRVGAAKMLEGASAAIVVIGDKDKSDTWIEDCSIAMGYMHLMAAEMGLGSCWIQGRGREAEDGRQTEDYVRDCLGIPENYGVEAILSLGIPKGEPRKTDVNELKYEKIHREKF